MHICRTSPHLSNVDECHSPDKFVDGSPDLTNVPDKSHRPAQRGPPGVQRSDPLIVKTPQRVRSTCVEALAQGNVCGFAKGFHPTHFKRSSECGLCVEGKEVLDPPCEAYECVRSLQKCSRKFAVHLGIDPGQCIERVIPVVDLMGRSKAAHLRIVILRHSQQRLYIAQLAILIPERERDIRASPDHMSDRQRTSVLPHVKTGLLFQIDKPDKIRAPA